MFHIPVDATLDHAFCRFRDPQICIHPIVVHVRWFYALWGQRPPCSITNWNRAFHSACRQNAHSSFPNHICVRAGCLIVCFLSPLRGSLWPWASIVGQKMTLVSPLCRSAKEDENRIGLDQTIRAGSTEEAGSWIRRTQIDKAGSTGTKGPLERYYKHSSTDNTCVSPFKDLYKRALWAHSMYRASIILE